MKFVINICILLVLCGVLYGSPIKPANQSDEDSSEESKESSEETIRPLRDTQHSAAVGEEAKNREKNDEDKIDLKPSSPPPVSESAVHAKRETEQKNPVVVHQMQDYLKSDTDREVTHKPPASASLPIVTTHQKRNAAGENQDQSEKPTSSTETTETSSTPANNDQSKSA